ncbi:hypothetical protein H8D29_06860 [PVC group bacterium]|jgi:tryptophanyl-tRNA synthetase|nr:hypothetical protein [PVC group bacterium]
MKNTPINMDDLTAADRCALDRKQGYLEAQIESTEKKVAELKKMIASLVQVELEDIRERVDKLRDSNE